MSLKDKYRSVLQMGEKFAPTDGYVEEKNGVLRMGSTLDTQYQKDQIWDEIKRIGGENPRDVEVDIKVKNKAYYAKHTVEKGDSLSKIAKEYLGDPMDYKRIYAANSAELDDPNKIYPGQVLTIPFPEGRNADS